MNIIYFNCSIQVFPQPSRQITECQQGTKCFIYYFKSILQITQASQYRCTQLQYRFAVISKAPLECFFFLECYCTVCPRSLDPFNVVTPYMNSSRIFGHTVAFKGGFTIYTYNPLCFAQKFPIFFFTLLIIELIIFLLKRPC